MSQKAEVDNAKKQVAADLLSDLENELDKGFIEDTFLVQGHYWKMRLLSDHEMSWAANYQRTSSALALVVSRRAPTLAIGIREIGKANGDGKPHMFSVAEFFTTQWEKVNKELDETTKSILASQNPYLPQYWFAEQLFHWLSKRNTEFVVALWEKWELLEKRRGKTEEVMGESSAEVGIKEAKVPSSASAK